MQQKEVINCATRIGSLMLQSGAEIYRVEQSIGFICGAYGFYDAEIFAIPSSIVVTISNGDDFITKTKRITSYLTNLDRVDRLNDLSRYISTAKPDYKSVMHMVDEIETRPVYPLRWHVFAYAIVSFFLTLFFGGNVVDATVAMGIGVLVKYLQVFMGTLKTNSFFINILCSAAIASVAYVIVSFYNNLDVDVVITGALMTLVPGMALANCMRDFIANDFIAGLIKLTDVLMTATAVAIGVAIVILVPQIFGVS